MRKIKVLKKLWQAVSAVALVSTLQSAAMAQNGCGYYGMPAPRNPIDIRMSALYDRVESMFDAGLLAPQERAELLRDLDGIQCYEIRTRITNPLGMSKCGAQHLNRQLDFFSSRLDARGTS